MHGNKKLCRIFLGKWISAGTEILTTKKPPSFATRGLFVWLNFIQQLRRTAFQQRKLVRLALHQSAFALEF